MKCCTFYSILNIFCLREILHHVQPASTMRVIRRWLISIVYRYWHTRNVDNILNNSLTFEHSMKILLLFRNIWNINRTFYEYLILFELTLSRLSHTFPITIIIIRHILRISQSQSKIIKNFQFLLTNFYGTSYRGSTMAAFRTVL